MRLTPTSIGEIAVYEKRMPGTIPVVFLHGVYYDHHLWNYFVSRITDRTTIAIDMPRHGKSKRIRKPDWSLADGVVMLEEILDALRIDRCYAIGHSWGSMTILRAATRQPQRFVKLGLCNLPLHAGSSTAAFKFTFQHTLLPLRRFYTKQAAKAMFAETSRQQNPALEEYLIASMGQLSNRDVRHTDRAVIARADDGFAYLDQLTVPAIALKGKEDYVPTPPGIETRVVEGKHTSPLEQPEQVMKMIGDVLT